MTASLFSPGAALGHWALRVVDVALVAYLFYRALLLLRGTRALQMLVGVLVILILNWISAESALDLRTTHWLLSSFLASLLIIVVVVFQNDIRRALSEVGKRPLLAAPGQSGVPPYEEIVQVAGKLAEKRYGAIIVLAREASLESFGQNGVPLDAKLSAPLLHSIFVPHGNNPLHDGAVLVAGDRILYAGCFLPLTIADSLDRELGTRHRAAIGVTEEVDALAIVVSEERGTISLAMDGEIERGLDANHLRARLQEVLRESAAPRWWERLLSRGGAGDGERS